MSELQPILNEVKESAVQLYGTRLSQIILYGSYARGDNTDESDMDIMIVLDCSADEIRKYRKLTAQMASEISLNQEVFLSISLRDSADFKKKVDFLPYYRNIAKEGVVIYG